MTDEFDTDFDDDDEQDTSEDEDKKSDDAADDKDSDSESTKDSSKRERELQSVADKATARANKLQKQLDEKAKPDAASDDSASGAVPPEVQVWLDSAKERTQESNYGSDPRFKAYSVDPAFIQGESPSAMKDSAERLAKLVTEIEGKVRNQVLVEHGFSPEPATSERSEPVNFGTMSREEFVKRRDAAIGNRTLRRS